MPQVFRVSRGFARAGELAALLSTAIVVALAARSTAAQAQEPATRPAEIESTRRDKHITYTQGVNGVADEAAKK